MGWISRDWRVAASKCRNTTDSVAGGYDSGVAAERHWGVRIMLACTSLALLATSSPHATHVFEETVSGPSLELTATSPRARFSIKARADGEGPGGFGPIHVANVVVRGTLQATEPSRFVRVRLSGSGAGNSELTVLTDFRLAHELQFTGNCTQPAAEPPCQAELALDLERTGSGSASGTVSISWSVDIEATRRIYGDDTDKRGLDLPWDIEVVRE